MMIYINKRKIFRLRQFVIQRLSKVRAVNLLSNDPAHDNLKRDGAFVNILSAQFKFKAHSSHYHLFCLNDLGI